MGGAASGVAEGYLVTKALGGQYSWGSAAVDGTLGAIGGLAAGFAQLRRLARIGSKADDVARAAVDANKLHHIFGNAEHGLDGLVEAFGSQENAFRAIEGAAQGVADEGAISDVFQTAVRVGGEDVTVRGRVINGIVKLGTAYIER